MTHCDRSSIFLSLQRFFRAHRHIVIYIWIMIRSSRFFQVGPEFEVFRSSSPPNNRYLKRSADGSYETKCTPDSGRRQSFYPSVSLYAKRIIDTISVYVVLDIAPDNILLKF